jgi:hypothetical protein
VVVEAEDMEEEMVVMPLIPVAMEELLILEVTLLMVAVVVAAHIIMAIQLLDAVVAAVE